MVTPAPAKSRSDIEILVERVNEYLDARIIDCSIPPLSVQHIGILLARRDELRWIRFNFNKFAEEIINEKE